MHCLVARIKFTSILSKTALFTISKSNFYLHLRRQNPSFAKENKAIVMKSTSPSRNAELFLRMLNEDHVYLYTPLEYSRLCELLHTCPQELDSELISLTGHRGKELEALMYTSYMDYLSKKYGLGLVNAQDS